MDVRRRRAHERLKETAVPGLSFTAQGRHSGHPGNHQRQRQRIYDTEHQFIVKGMEQ